MISDEDYMTAAIALSQRGRGLTGANPNVGCIVVKDDSVIGRGWTQASGRPHAEALALAEAGKETAGADIFTTLEPCAHESKRGPACSDLIIAAQPKRVIIGCVDPDPRTHNIGVSRMRDAGIEVVVNMCQAQARRAMAGFFTRIQKRRPFITLKLALSLDGCIAMENGSSQWITGARARAHGHLERARSDAILVGAGTVRADNPSLNVRLTGLESHSPERVMLGSGPAPDDWVGIATPENIADLANLNWLLIEGGAQTASAFLKANMVDRLLLYRAPIIIGGGMPGIADIGLASLSDAHGQWLQHDRRNIGEDVLEIYDRAA